MTTTFAGHLLTGDHASRPGFAAVPQGTLYSCTDHNLVYQSDGTSAWTTWATLGAASLAASAVSVSDSGGHFTGTDVEAALGEVGAVLDDGNKLTLPEGSAPSTPASGFGVAYFKTDGRMYSKDDSGTEYGPFDVAGGGGGGGPLLYLEGTETITDPFTDISGWTVIGGASSADDSSPYHTICQKLTCPSQGDGIRRAYPGDGVACYVTVPEISDVGAMFGIAFTDSSGNGTGLSVYNDDKGYKWAIAGGNYSSTLAAIVSGINLSETSWPSTLVYKIVRVGTTVTLGISYDGGVTFVGSTQTDATTFTQVRIARFWTTGGGGFYAKLGAYIEV